MFVSQYKLSKWLLERCKMLYITGMMIEERREDLKTKRSSWFRTASKWTQKTSIFNRRQMLHLVDSDCEDKKRTKTCHIIAKCLKVETQLFNSLKHVCFFCFHMVFMLPPLLQRQPRTNHEQKHVCSFCFWLLLTAYGLFSGCLR